MSFIDDANQVLNALEAKISLVKDEDLKNQPGSTTNFSKCKEQYYFLNGVLQNQKLETILEKLKGNESGFNAGIKNLNSIIQTVDNGLGFLGVVDRVVSILANITSFFI